MARLVGYAGEVTITAGAVAGIREWSLDDVANTADTSGFDTDQPKTFLATQTEWSGSFNGFKDGAPLAKGTVVAIELKESATATQKWTGNVLITGRRPAGSVDGMIMYSYDFQGTGALTPPSA